MTTRKEEPRAGAARRTERRRRPVRRGRVRTCPFAVSEHPSPPPRPPSPRAPGRGAGSLQAGLAKHN